MYRFYSTAIIILYGILQLFFCLCNHICIWTMVYRLNFSQFQVHAPIRFKYTLNFFFNKRPQSLSNLSHNKRVSYCRHSCKTQPLHRGCPLCAHKSNSKNVVLSICFFLFSLFHVPLQSDSIIVWISIELVFNIQSFQSSYV